MAQFAGNRDPAIQKIVQVVQCLEVLLRHNNDYSDYKLLLRKHLVYLKNLIKFIKQRILQTNILFQQKYFV